MKRNAARNLEVPIKNHGGVTGFALWGSDA